MAIKSNFSCSWDGKGDYTKPLKTTAIPYHDKQLIHGDNLNVMHSIMDEYKGKIKLIYIDPPFMVGKDFVNKEGEFAYSDKWKSVDEFLCFIHERLIIMRELLSDDGSIYVHCDHRLNSYLRLIMDEVFGKENFRNEIVWGYKTYQGQVRSYFPRKHDSIFFYSKSGVNIFKLLKDNNPSQTIDFTRWQTYLNNNNEITGGNYPKTDSRFLGYYKRFIQENHRKPGPHDVILKIDGNTIDSVWYIKSVDPKNTNERLSFPTQKPEALLERIIKASSNEGDLVADFFCGSGTTGAVAEKLGRKWLMTDMGDLAIKTTKERLEKLNSNFELNVVL